MNPEPRSRPLDTPAADEGEALVAAPLQGTVVSIDVMEGDAVAPGRCVAVMESMKMEHEVRAETAGIVRRVHARAGDTVYAGHPLLVLEEADVDDAHGGAEEAVDPDHIRPDLKEVLDAPRRDTRRCPPQGLWLAVAPSNSAPPARTSRTWWMREPGWNTARW